MGTTGGSVGLCGEGWGHTHRGWRGAAGASSRVSAPQEGSIGLCGDVVASRGDVGDRGRGWTSDGEVVCPACGPSATRRNGCDRQGRQVHQCRGCGRRFTARTATPCLGYRFPPEVIALAVRWYLRYRLSDADVAELLAERGVAVDPSSIFAWVRAFAPL